MSLRFTAVLVLIFGFSFGTAACYNAEQEEPRLPIQKPPVSVLAAPADPTFLDQPPLPGLRVDADFPSPFVHRLKNGLEIVVLPRKGMPVVSAMIMIDRGRTDALPAFAEAFASCFFGPSTRFSSGEASAVLHKYGVSYGSIRAPQWTGLHITALDPFFFTALDTALDMVLHTAPSDVQFLRRHLDGNRDLRSRNPLAFTSA
jgi:hypothetical protein